MWYLIVSIPDLCTLIYFWWILLLLASSYSHWGWSSIEETLLIFLYLFRVNLAAILWSISTLWTWSFWCGYHTDEQYSRPFQSGTSFMDLSCFCSVLCLLCLCARLFICALWSPAGKGLTSWLSFAGSNCEFVTFPLVSWVRCGTWLYLFLIFAPLLTLIWPWYNDVGFSIFFAWP